MIYLPQAPASRPAAVPHSRARFHQVLPSTSESFQFEEIQRDQYGCSWHFHPEYQLGLVLRSAGYRIVGDNITPLRAGDFTFLGPNLPHLWSNDEEHSRNRRGVHALVVHFREDFLGSEFLHQPEVLEIGRLFARSATGLRVTGHTRERAAEMLQALGAHHGFKRLLDLLEILQLLAEAPADDLHHIASAGFAANPAPAPGESERVTRVCRYIHEHLGEPLCRDEAAAVIHLSPSAFSRYFKRHTGKNFHDFVSELRVGRACRLLSEGELNVTEIAYACGFGNLASFNRCFRRLKKANPTEFRRRLLHELH
jgi:AraC-like DNA-binding protein/quercetin dioxygenase-like cupin family protein